MKTKHKTNPFSIKSKEEFDYSIIQGTALVLIFYILYNEDNLEIDLSIKTVQNITKISKPSIIKGIKELEERKIIAKSNKKSIFYVNPKILIGLTKIEI